MDSPLHDISIRTVLRGVVLTAVVVNLEACGRAGTKTDQPFEYQIVRLPGTPSCSLMKATDPPGAPGYPEVIGFYHSKADAEAALKSFASTQDPMTVPGTTICQKK